ncbi:MAG: CDP-alcohol phosphatidyltransferase family protein [Gammaproteobacteria bacterium]|nr:CDP-alcohol phosphatidyltransferase family protein [Gammaproteobacteria bacterium]
MTLYDIKPQFQSLLRPLVKRMAETGITANQVTIAAAICSVIIGGLLVQFSHLQSLFLVLPAWMFIRMALNAIDGMLAREFAQKSNLGAYLNELCDVISDVALFIPFAFVAPFTELTLVLVVFLALFSEFSGVLGLSIQASRRYDGPLGKSDRAFIFAVLGLWVGVGGAMPDWLFWIMPILSVLISVTIINRIKQALAEVNQRQLPRNI